jgi:hypothetical protein
MLWLIDHPWCFFPILLSGLLACVSLGFTLRMAQPHYDHRKEIIVNEANGIAIVHLRAEMLPEPFRKKILGQLRE